MGARYHPTISNNDPLTKKTTVKHNGDKLYEIQHIERVGNSFQSGEGRVNNRQLTWTTTVDWEINPAKGRDSINCPIPIVGLENYPKEMPKIPKKNLKRTRKVPFRSRLDYVGLG